MKDKYSQSQLSWEANYSRVGWLNRLHKHSPEYSLSPTICENWYPLDHGFITHHTQMCCCYVLLPVWEPEVHFQLSVIWPALNIWYLLLLTVGRISVRYLLTMNCWHLFIPFAVSSMFYGIFWEWSIIDKTQFSSKILEFTVAEKNFSWEYFLQAI